MATQGGYGQDQTSGYAAHAQQDGGSTTANTSSATAAITATSYYQAQVQQQQRAVAEAQKKAAEEARKRQEQAKQAMEQQRQQEMLAQRHAQVTALTQQVYRGFRGRAGYLPPSAMRGAMMMGRMAIGPDGQPIYEQRTEPWVEQLAKSPASAWQPIRCGADLARRFPMLCKYLDFTKLTCHFTPSDLARVNLSPSAQVDINPDNKAEFMGDMTESKEKSVHSIRVVIPTTAKEINEKHHLSKKFHFLLVQHPKNHLSFPGGDISPEDGEDPTDFMTLKKSAIRHTKTALGIDVSSCPFEKFMTVTYEREDESVCHTHFLLTDVSSLPSPLVTYQMIKDEEVEVINVHYDEVELTEAEIEQKKKEFTEKIARERAVGRAIVPGEREVLRLERLERLEERLVELETNPAPIPTTKKIARNEKGIKVVTHQMRTPMVSSLHSLVHLPQNPQQTSTPLCQYQFEIKLFGLLFDELLRRNFGEQIVEWLKTYKVRKMDEDGERSRKRKLDEMENVDAIEKERKRKEKAERKAKLEADRAQREAEGQPVEDLEPEEEEEEQPEPEPPAKKPTRFVHELDEVQAKPFLYFDTHLTEPTGFIKKDDLVILLHSVGDLCHREVQELLQPTSLPLPGVAQMNMSTFNYRLACSSHREEEIEEAPVAAEQTNGQAEQATPIAVEA